VYLEHSEQPPVEGGGPDISSSGMMTATKAKWRFYNTTPDSIADDAIAKLLPMAVSPFTSTTKYCGWKDHGIAVQYVGCKHDNALPPAMQKQYMGQASLLVNDFDGVWLDCDHSPFLSMPGKLADLLQAGVLRSA
jgi:hypothetical protein